MSFLDRAKDKLNEVADSGKLQDVAGRIDEKTGGKLSEAADRVADKVPGADKVAEKLGLGSETATPEPPTPEPPTPEPPTAEPPASDPPAAP